jgi:hypothetical protein
MTAHGYRFRPASSVAERLAQGQRLHVVVNRQTHTYTLVRELALPL